MDLSGVMFCRVTGKVFLPWGIVKSEELLGLSVEKPKIMHLHCTQTLSFEGGVHYSHDGGVIDVDGGERLVVSHFFKSIS